MTKTDYEHPQLDVIYFDVEGCFATSGGSKPITATPDANVSVPNIPWVD